jgi:hypothetical protein
MVLPSTMDADGTAVTVRGSNFGREQDVHKWTEEEASVAVSIGASCVARSRCLSRRSQPASIADLLVCGCVGHCLLVRLAGGVVCANTQRVTRANSPALECTMPRQTVGFKNVTISVAAQNGSLPAERLTLIALCSRNNFGRMDELVRADACARQLCLCVGLWRLLPSSGLAIAPRPPPHPPWRHCQRA